MGADGDFVARLRIVSDRDVARLREYFLDAAHDFDAACMDDHLLFPLEMTWFYGEPSYAAMSVEDQLKLNRLTFCQNYLSTLVGEGASNILNYEAALGTLLNRDPETAFYMAREVVEETFHFEAFYIVVAKVLQHYGIPFAECKAKNGSLRLAVWYARFHTLLGWLRGNLDYYYFTRYPLNISQKTIERSTIKEPRMHPIVRTILKNHAVDEARHMQMSRETGKLALARLRSPVVRAAACALYAQYAASINMGGRHAKGGWLNRDTRISVLEMCGMTRAAAARAYREWRDRLHQPDDPPLVRAARLYFVRLNNDFIDELDVSPRQRAHMRRTIGRAYADVTDSRSDTIQRLEFDDLTRTA